MHRTILLLATVAAFGGCSKSDKTNGKLESAPETISPTAIEEPAGPSIDPCALLTSEEVQAVLGEPIQDVRRFCA